MKEKVCLNLRARFCCAMKIVVCKRPVRVLVTLAVLQTQTCREKDLRPSTAETSFMREQKLLVCRYPVNFMIIESV